LRYQVAGKITGNGGASAATDLDNEARNGGAAARIESRRSSISPRPSGYRPGEGNLAYCAPGPLEGKVEHHASLPYAELLGLFAGLLMILAA
jgi:hypothetical protein